MDEAQSTGRIGGVGDVWDEDCSLLGVSVRNEVAFESGQGLELSSGVVDVGVGESGVDSDWIFNLSGVKSGEVGIVLRCCDAVSLPVLLLARLTRPKFLAWSFPAWAAQSSRDLK